MTKDPLKLETRRKIFEFIVKYPGVHMREIERSLGLSVQLLGYHLRILEKWGLISVLESDKYKRFYPGVKRIEDARTLAPEDKRILALLRQRIPLSIVLFLLEVETARAGEISAKLNIPPSTLSYHLGKLEKGGLIKRTTSGEERGIELIHPDHILRLLIAYKPLSEDMFDRFISIWRELY